MAVRHLRRQIRLTGAPGDGGAAAGAVWTPQPCGATSSNPGHLPGVSGFSAVAEVARRLPAAYGSLATSATPPGTTHQGGAEQQLPSLAERGVSALHSNLHRN